MVMLSSINVINIALLISFYNIVRMKREPPDPKSQQDRSLQPDGYRLQGLMILARIIARAHIERTLPEKKDKTED